MRDTIIALIAASLTMFILTFLIIFYRDGWGIGWIGFFIAGVGFAVSAIYIAVQNKRSST